MKRRLMLISLSWCYVAAFVQAGELKSSKESSTNGQEIIQGLAAAEATRNLEYQSHAQKRSQLAKLTPGPQRDALMRQEMLRHQAELKRLSMTRTQYREKVIGDLKQRWEKVSTDWTAECSRHTKTNREIDSMAPGPQKDAAMANETARHRAASKKLAVDRNMIHQGVMQQANRDVMGGNTGASNAVKQTAGTRINDPNHRGMNGDFDAGGGYRTTEKVEKILQEMGVKGPGGQKVKMNAGVLETGPDFGMTVNASPGSDRVGSAGHQSQVKVSAGHGETYISETGGAVRSKTLKDHLATLDHSKKAMHGLGQSPSSLVGGSADGQAMVKGALKAANQSGLSPESIQSIARQRGIKNPENILDKLTEIKAGRVAISSVDEAARLQGVTMDILTASQSASRSRAKATIQEMERKIVDLETKGQGSGAAQMRKEIADYRAKSKAAAEALGTEIESSRTKSVRGQSEAKPTAGGKLVKVGGLALGAYGIYEGYNTAKEEMEARKKAEPQTITGWTKEKAELAARTFWHGLGFGAAAEIGSQSGKEAYEQYKRDIDAGKISADSWSSYLAMKHKALYGALFGFGKAITYDAAKQSGTSLGIAISEGKGASKDIASWLQGIKEEKATHEERAKQIYDKLIQKGASTAGAKCAADAVRKGDYSEASRLNKILESKRAAKLALAETEEQQRSRRERKKRELKQAGKAVLKPAETSSIQEDEEAKLRETVVARLNARELPVVESLVNRLIDVLKKDGSKGLDEAIAEISSMQGTFVGSLKDSGRLVIAIQGSRVTGSWIWEVKKGSGKYVAVVTTSCKLKGDVDLTIGAISMMMSGTTKGSGLAAGMADSTLPPMRLTGTFTGSGYKGQTADGSLWLVRRQ